jgi:simple sugar transport system ATP-binding protein
LNEKREPAVSNINFKVNQGEIVGIAGVQGNGQTELIEALTGNRKPSQGQFLFFNQNSTSMLPRQIHKMGIRHIPEDRQKSGIITEFSVAENLILNTYYQGIYSKGPLLKKEKVKSETKKIIKKFDIRTSSEEIIAGNLSGGNQQKLVVGREMSNKMKFLIAAQPTRGVDVGSIEYIHNQIVSARNEGNGILLVSTELEEILALSDRILVLFRGKIVAEFDSTVSPSEIGLAMAGIAA